MVIRASASGGRAAAYLVYLGITTIRSGSDGLPTRHIDTSRLSKTSFVQGFGNNLLNPKGTLFYLGIFTTVITPATSPSAMLVLVATMMFVSGCFWICFVYALDRRTLRDLLERSQRAVSRLVGGLLILMGLRLASTSLNDNGAILGTAADAAGSG